MLHRNNIILASAIAGALGVSTTGYAKVDMDATNANPVKVLTQISSDGADLQKAAAADTTYDVKVKVGQAIKFTDESFVRFDLSSGAEFKANSISLSIDADSVPPASIAVNLAGGGKGESFVIFSIKNNDNESNAGADSVIHLEFKDASSDLINVAGSNDNINITYNLYRIAEEASAADSSLYNKSVEYIAFESAFSFSTAVETKTADVENDFLTFTDGKVEGQLATLSFTSAETTDNVYLPSGSKVDSVDDILSTTSTDNKITVTGDFTSLADSDGGYDVSRLFLTDEGKCSEGYDLNGSAMTTASLTEEEAVIDLKVPTTASKTYSLCIKRDENSEVAYKAAEYNLDFNVATDTAGGVVVSNFEGQKAGKIVRDGTVLDTPYFTLDPTNISRIILSNFGTTDAKFTVNVQSDEGTTVTQGSVTSGTITAGTILQIRGSELASFSGKQRGSAKFTIVAPPKNISGVYQNVNLTSGAVTSIKMIHEGGKH
jgi:hypothetical protein